MLKIENFEVVGWEHAIRGMRNPMNSWDKSDSLFFDDDEGHYCKIGQARGHRLDLMELKENDRTLMINLAKGGPVHAKYRRMIAVYLDVTAPLYWWKEFDTYKVGTVRNSCSTMHKIHSKEFTLDDFSHEHLIDCDDPLMDNFESLLHEEEGPVAISGIYLNSPLEDLEYTIGKLNVCRRLYLHAQHKPMKEEAKRAGLMKKYWWQMIQLLPSSYNQRATIMLNYEVLVGIYRDRKNHKLDEWHVFCDWISELPYSEIIIGERD